MAGVLYVVGTPIGNLSDMTQRGIETLNKVDFIAAEDTRVTVKLLNHFGIKKPMLSYFEHNKKERGEIICSRIIQGESCAIVTDAGMPAISDPGELLVKQCAEQNIKTVVVPGPSAVVSALALSGLPTGRFTFEGFLSMNKKSRRAHLQELINEKRTMVFYEAPHKLNATLADLLEAFGDRNIAIVRELTKIHEEVIRTTLQQSVNKYREKPLKGEIVLIISGKEETDEKEYTMAEAVNMAAEMLKQNGSVSQAAKDAAHLTGIKKGDIYKCLLERDEDGDV